MRVIFLLLFISQAFSLAIDYKRDATPIKRLQLFSERCSGSNYLSALLLEHFDFDNTFTNTHKRHSSPYGHKHFPAWLDASPETFLGPRKWYDFTESDDCLFIVIFRNPYDWVRSFYGAPWHATPEVASRSFEDFIRLPWEFDINCPVMRYQCQYNPLIDRNTDGTLFKTVFALRTAKIKNMLAIKNKVKNIYFVNYETVKASPRKFIKEIAKLYQLQITQPFHNIVINKGAPHLGLYKEKQYPPISSKDLKHINKQLNTALEASIGYDRPLDTL